MVEVAEKKKGRGRAKLLYEITDEGLNVLSKDLRISSEEFWEIGFFVYDVKINPNVTFPLEEFFSNYERTVLGYSFEYALLGWGILLDQFGIIHSIPDKPSPRISLLYELGLNGPQSLQELSACFNSKMKQGNDLNGLLSDMVANKLLLEIPSAKKSKYRLSSLGFLLVMNYFDKTRPEELNRDNVKNFTKIVRTLIQNADALPLISDNWPILREIINELNIVQFFKWIANGGTSLYDSIRLGGVSELITVEQIMGKTYRGLISHEQRVGLSVVSNIRKEKTFEPKSHKIEDKLLYLGILVGYNVQNQDEFLRSLRDKNFVLDEVIERSLSSRISFEFFTHFIDWVVRERKMAGDLDMIKNDVASIYSSKVKKWNRFQRTNKEFRDWYSAWIDEIRLFEEKNAKILKEKDFMKV